MSEIRIAFMPTGTVYGVLLNFRAEVEAMAAQMRQPPYKAPPQAPVLYVKTANTWSPHGSAIALPPHVPEVEIGATIAMVIGDQGRVAGHVLMNDLSIPHASFFRPPVKYKCLDGFWASDRRCERAAIRPASRSNCASTASGAMRRTFRNWCAARRRQLLLLRRDVHARRRPHLPDAHARGKGEIFHMKAIPIFAVSCTAAAMSVE